LVEERLFKFTGCEICNISDVLQPCPNSTNLFAGFDTVASFDDIKNKVKERTTQGTYCAIEGSGEKSFCFYDYNSGELEPVNNAEYIASLNTTAAPSAQSFEQEVTAPPVTPPSTPAPTEFLAPPDDLTQPSVPVSTEAPTDGVPAPTDEPVPAPTDEPVPVPTDLPTDIPTKLVTRSPTAAPVDAPDPGPDNGSDGFNMDEIGSDAFNPNDFFGKLRGR
jgi:hypothetical protein